MKHARNNKTGAGATDVAGLNTFAYAVLVAFLTALATVAPYAALVIAVFFGGYLLLNTLRLALTALRGLYTASGTVAAVLVTVICWIAL